MAENKKKDTKKQAFKLSNKTFYKLGNNIRGLRKAWGLSQKELGEKFDITKQAISDYELGKKFPERDILIAMSQYFGIPEDELLHGNYAKLPKIAKLPVGDMNYTKAAWDKFLPIVCTDMALMDKDFKQAYALHIELYQSIIKGVELNEFLLKKCLALYEKSFQNGIIEGVANTLWWLLFLGMIHNLASPQLIEGAKLLQDGEIDFIELVKRSFLGTLNIDTQSKEYKEFETMRNAYLEENEVEIFVKIRLLKLSKEYADLGDYYLAVVYLCNIIRNKQSPEMNRAMAFEMLSIYSLLGNPYAKKLQIFPKIISKSTPG